MEDMTRHNEVRTALVTGASRGLGRAIARYLADIGWHVIADARHANDLGDALAAWPTIELVPGDIADLRHREQLAHRAAAAGGLDLLVNNASSLGPSPLPPLSTYPIDDLRDVLETNVIAPLALAQALLPQLRARRGLLIGISSDAAVEAYPGWGGYGASKAALDQLTAVLAAEEADVSAYSFDPGDMRTAMHQLAFPGEDISDRPEPETVIPALVRLIEVRPAAGRYRAADLAVEVAR
jgi:NAD(P)-dependent dehydrogenase (short-subunit alcohol dehydrogenase family)